ncbi:MAG: helix-turn-helix transcriptional regulator [Leucobacter sp.]
MTRSLTAPDRVVLLLALVPYLHEHGPTSVSELARTFGVPAETLRSLVAFLGTAGVPGETHTYQPEDLFDIDWDAFEEQDLVSLTRIVAVDQTPRFSPAEYAALLAGLHVLGEMLPGEDQDLVASTAAKLARAIPRKTDPEGNTVEAPSISVTADPADPGLSTLLLALERGRRVAFEYRDLEGRTTLRTVEPLALTEGSGGWYLRAYCLDRAAERTFLVDAMRGTRVLDAQAERRAASAEREAPLAPESGEIVAQLRLRERALHRIGGFSPEVRGEAEPGWLRAEVRLTHPAAAVRLVQAAPGDLVIESPAEARDAVRDWAERALAPYGD